MKRRRWIFWLTVGFVVVAMPGYVFYVSALPAKIDACLRLDQPEGALTYANRLVWLWPSAETYHRRCRVHWRNGDYSAAASDLDAARKRGLANELCDLETCLFQADMGKFATHEPALWSVFASGLADEPEVCAVLAQGYKKRFELNKVLQCCTQWEKLDPADVRQFRIRAEVREMLNDPAATVAQEYQAVIRLDPHDVQARKRLATLLAVAGNGEQAKAHLDYLLQIGEEDAEIHYASGLCCRVTDPARARTHFQKCIQENPKHVEALNELALLELESGEWANAETVLRQAIDTDPNHTLSWLRLATVLSRLRQREQAQAAMERYQKLKDLSDEFDRLRRELLKNPADIDAMEQIIRGFQTLGQEEHARRWALRLTQFDPDNTLAAEQLRTHPPKN